MVLQAGAGRACVQSESVTLNFGALRLVADAATLTYDVHSAQGTLNGAALKDYDGRTEAALARWEQRQPRKEEKDAADTASETERHGD